MEPFNELTGAIALTLGAGWASRLILYAAMLVLGLLGATGNIVYLHDYKKDHKGDRFIFSRIEVEYRSIFE
jgi:hypothetical protein